MIYVQFLVLCFAGIIIWLILTNFRESHKEHMRTIPRPNPNYDPNEYVTIKNNNPNRLEKININDEIDTMIKLYFGRNNIPTTFSIAMYYQYFVNQGNVSLQNKMRLKDLCYYILQYVIPSIPSELNPDPTIEWPYIEFLSNSLKSHTVQSVKTYSPLVMYQVTPYEYDQLNIDRRNGLDAPGLNGPGSDTSSGNNASGSSSGDDSNSNKNKNSSGCGCPTACFANLLATMNDTSNNSPGSESSSSSSSSSSNSSSPGKNNKSDKSINTPGGYSTNNVLADPSLFSNTNNMPLSDLKITNEPQKKKTGTLDSSINDFINNYFGIDPESGIGKPIDDMPIPSQLLPTNFGKVEFTDFFKTRTLIDQNHKTKLYDLVHYFMENIVVGLPTDTVPFSYVEWRPIVWSSVSYI